MKQSLSVARGR